MTKFGDPQIDALRFFARNVRRLRMERGESAGHVADQLGWDPGVLLNLIEEACDPSLTVAEAAELAHTLGVPLADLFKEPHEPE